MKLENEFLKLQVTTCGGTMTSIYDKRRNVELLYQKNPDSWQGQDAFIFPFIARLKDGYYTHNGKRYDFKNHGLIRYMISEDVVKEDNFIEIMFHSDKDTLKRYPFDFEAKIKYELLDNKIKISYDILNKSKEDMPFELGAHPAFRLPGQRKKDEYDISGNYIEFDSIKNLKLMEQEDTFSFVVGEMDYLDTDVIALDKKLFNDINTLILKADDISTISLYKKDTSRITLKVGDVPFIALWSDMKWGDYVCIEPWTGLPDYVEPEREITKKPFIKLLKPNQHFNYSYEIIVD